MTNLITALFVFIVVVVGAMGTIYIVSSFEDQHLNVIGDPVNNTGILSGQAYDSVHIISSSAVDIAPTTILIALLLVVIILVVVVWGILKTS